MIIIGAGMAGLLAGAFYQRSNIYEAAEQLPDGHKALLRFKSDKISKFTGIPMKKVTIHKSIWHDGTEWKPTPRLSHWYSQKATGRILQRSILNIDPVVRWIPPRNFSNQLAARCGTRIKFNKTITSLPDGEIVISTMPMPSLAKMVGEKMPHCSTSAVVVNRFTVPNCDSYATVYYPDPDVGMYRATLQGDTLIVEGTAELTFNNLQDVKKSLGLLVVLGENETFRNYYNRRGKVVPINENWRKDFIYRMTMKHNVYSLGRYACWRPGVMLDDVLDDIFVIHKLITQGGYTRAKHIGR